MITFDPKTGRFRDEKGFRSDISGLLSSSGRRTFKQWGNNKTLEMYRKSLGKKYYKEGEREPDRKKTVIIRGKVAEGKRRKKEFEPTDIKNYQDYIDDWLDDFEFVLEEDDTDLETP